MDFVGCVGNYALNDHRILVRTLSIRTRRLIIKDLRRYYLGFYTRLYLNICLYLFTHLTINQFLPARYGIILFLIIYYFYIYNY